MTSAKDMDQPGHGFHPTEKELIDYYLPHKIRGNHSHVSAIAEIDNIYKHEPWDLPGRVANPSSMDICHFFSPRNSERTKRLTEFGFWKVTGKKREIKNRENQVIIKRYLVFFTGRSSNPVWTEWAMHEYYLKPSSPNERGYVIYCLHQKPVKPPKKSVISVVDKGEPGCDSALVFETPVTNMSSSEIDLEEFMDEILNSDEQDFTSPTGQQPNMHISQSPSFVNVLGTNGTIDDPLSRFGISDLQDKNTESVKTGASGEQNNISELEKSYSASIDTAPGGDNFWDEVWH
ncbi:transcription factor JUNGBRUNNEN 1-like [Tripterygium wilfordii]|uniref:Transcription factor JUNGBRUNNEN 1-like n=1 Tax=Tripterygium wilfordii TaxID=458696 RepID=A0A7J7CD18_TRIWF|nr:NAC domain-containing protein 71-like [Tripterygium wilfordii]XP_038684474.1 NAC domain-containing protein 71-like [Tripterygium wilfordii]KAF5732023.1 transcription factor JUNGBRUNNEN 1-like [Tripterygium wilfordii]